MGARRKRNGEGDLPKAIRLFAGVFITEGPEGLVVNAVLPHGPAERAGLKKGDLLVSVSKRSPLSLDGFAAALGKTSSVVFVRKSRSHTTTLRPVNLYGGGVMPIAKMLRRDAKAGKKCNSECDCTIPLRNSICETWYVTKGNGPQGGVLLEEHCTYSAIPPGGAFEGAVKNCGTFEFF